MSQIACENVIYESTPGDFVTGYSQDRLKIINKLSGNCNRTRLQYLDDKNTVIQEKSSDNLVKLIGQENYNLLLTLLSLLNLEVKVRILLIILTKNDILSSNLDKVKQDSEETQQNIKFVENSGEVISNNEMITIKTEEKPRTRKRPKTYVVTEANKSEQNRKITLEIENKIKNESSVTKQEILKNISKTIAAKTQPEKYSTVEKEVNAMVIQETKKKDLASELPIPPLQELSPASIKLPDGSNIMVSMQPEDMFHIATPEILKNVIHHEQKKLIEYQLYIDWKYCLDRNNEEFLPLHLAVQFNDLDLVQRQCFMLLKREESVDIPANNMTALQISLALPDTRATSILLRYGADPLYRDEDESTVLHMASELKTDHLKVLLEFCTKNARQILNDNETLKDSSMENKSDSELAAHLLNHMCQAVDTQGYTPLMIASRLGLSSNVLQLVKASPSTVNKVMPNSGRTAVYLAVEAACLDAIQRGNKSTVGEEFAETLTTLIENDADVTIANFSGVDANELLQEYNMPGLMKLFTSLVMKKMINTGQSIDKYAQYMIVKEKGEMSVTEIGKKNKKPPKKNDKKGKGVATKNENELKNVKEPKRSKKIDTQTKATVIDNSRIVVLKNTIVKEQTASTSQNTVATKKPITIKRNAPLNHGIVISKLKNNVMYFPTELNLNATGNSTTKKSKIITIKSNILCDNISLKRSGTSAAVVPQVKKKKNDSSILHDP